MVQTCVRDGNGYRPAPKACRRMSVQPGPPAGGKRPGFNIEYQILNVGFRSFYFLYNKYFAGADMTKGFCVEEKSRNPKIKQIMVQTNHT